MRRAKKALTSYKPSFWMVVVLIALVGIVAPKLTGDGLISTLMALLLLFLIFAKALSITLRIVSILAAITLVILVLAYWLLTSAGF